jgi:hypothetical protein
MNTFKKNHTDTSRKTVSVICKGHYSWKVTLAVLFLSLMGTALLSHSISSFSTDGFTRESIFPFFIGLIFFMSTPFMYIISRMYLVVYSDDTLILKRPKMMGGDISFSWQDIDSVIENPHRLYADWLTDFFNTINPYTTQFTLEVKDNGLIFILKDGRRPFVHFTFSNIDIFLKLMIDKLDKEKYKSSLGLIESVLNHK